MYYNMSCFSVHGNVNSKLLTGGREGEIASFMRTGIMIQQGSFLLYCDHTKFNGAKFSELIIWSGFTGKQSR